MKKQLLKEIIEKKEKKIEFAIITNLDNGESCLFEKNKPKHSLTTAVSTHPPDTDPEKSPLSFIIIRLPVGLGDEPQVSMTVAKTTFRFAASQSLASSSIFSSNELFICFSLI